ncbi:DUF1513 domain-containing protein [Vibrio rumoiensis]|uniref:DUF1513 domain-containing protein n=1 Tax=Vibrio rumoiensis 1S-45 TaxID=1188252 RepID=A0A1E5E673_9VIBR|nr:hypothetical protein A1QC_04515 [Vibrio rumoiensis 1S-45]
METKSVDKTLSKDHSVDAKRRKLLMLAALGGGATALGGLSWLYQKNNQPQAALIGNSVGFNQQFHSVVADWQGNPIFQIPLPERAHGVAISQMSTMGFTDAVAFARRPGSYFQVFDYNTGEKKQLIQAEGNRHFYGHGVFSLDGQYLLATQGIQETSQGLIGVYDVNNGYKKVDEWHGIGIGPHEIIRLNNGSYAVGVGGVHTYGREPLNLDTMQPTLTRLDSQGNITCQVGLADKKLSIRHLGYDQHDLILCGQQYRGEPDDYPSLIAMQKGDGELTLLNAEPEEWAMFNHYIASIAVVDDYVLATSPPGNCYGIWSISQNKLLELNPLPDASGVVAHQGRFYVSSGSGEVVTRKPINEIQHHNSKVRWDNHWNAIPS